MQTLREIQQLLAERGLKPRRRFGQNFLHDHNLLRRLVNAADIPEGGLVLEIGPGTGTLTEALLERNAEVIAVEIDRDLSAILNDRFGDRIHLIQGDCLGRSRRLATPLVEAIGGRPFSLVSNLPYEIASPLMVEILMSCPSCRGQWITIQHEVADRLMAQPDTSAWGPLGIIVQSGADVIRLASVPATCFWPQPLVRSAMVELKPKSRPPTREFAAFVTKLFGSRRKQLGGVLGANMVESIGIDPTWRCERLDLPALQRLYEIAF